MDLRDKIVLITGASEGIGAACAAAFRRRGARLALTARSEDKLRAIGGPDALILPADLHSPEARASLVKTTAAHFGGIDVLLNNAGVGLYAPSHQAQLADARALFDLNVLIPLELAQHAAEYMKKQRRGCIVNVGSIAGKITLPWFTLYSASKYALGSMTDGMRIELKPYGVHAMLVCPGYVKTGFQQHVIAGAPPPLLGWSRRWAITPERCAEDVVRGIERGKRTVVTPRTGWLLIALARLFPGVYDRVLGAANQGHTRGREGAAPA